MRRVFFLKLTYMYSQTIKSFKNLNNYYWKRANLWMIMNLEHKKYLQSCKQYANVATGFLAEKDDIKRYLLTEHYIMLINIC